jgi:Domain of unknown function (DUF1906)
VFGRMAALIPRDVRVRSAARGRLIERAVREVGSRFVSGTRFVRVPPLLLVPILLAGCAGPQPGPASTPSVAGGTSARQPTPGASSTAGAPTSPAATLASTVSPSAIRSVPSCRQSGSAAVTPTSVTPTSVTPTSVTPTSVTPGGLWWSVDSSGPMTDGALAAVRAWYRGAAPQVWGRYLTGSYSITPTELAWARSHRIYVYLLIPDDNCSRCDSGADICGNDKTASQARENAAQTLMAARALPVPAGAALFKDLEQVAACVGEPTAAYLRAWFGAVRNSGYRVGLYGNSTTADYAFPRAYCQVLRTDPRLGAEVLLDATEPEPDLGKPAGASGPRNAPPFRPATPPCAPPSATVIWQYGESIDNENYADIDQVRPDTPGLLAPDGTVTTGRARPRGALMSP